MADLPKDGGEELRVLFHACRVGRTDIIQHAVSSMKTKNADVQSFISAADENGDTGLHIAAHNGHSDAVRALLNIGADPSIIPSVGEFAGKSAYEVASGGAVNAFHVYTFEQVAMGHLSEIRNLVKGKVSPNIVDDTNLRDSALHWACSFGNVEVGMLLLDLGGNVNITNSAGQSCLHAACRARNADFIMMLLKYGVNISLLDVDGKLAVEYLPDDGASLSDLADIINKHVEGYSGNSIPVAVQNTSGALDINQKMQAISPLQLAVSELKRIGSDHEGQYERDSVVSSIDNGSGYESDSGWDEVNMGHASPEKASRIAARGLKYIPHDINTKQIIIWPPAQRQVQYSALSASHMKLLLHSDVPVIISSASGGIDIYPLLTWSGLVDTLENLGFRSQVQRGTSRAHVKLAISQDICPGRHRFEIRIDSNMACLTASDGPGLMYAIHAFIQILTLHSDVVTISSQNTVLEIPSMLILDWPDIPNRGVVWSYRSTVRMQSGAMKRLVRLFSAIRTNQLFLGVDLEEDGVENDTADKNKQLLGTKLCSLDEVCRRLFVDLIPTVTITKRYQRLPVDTLRNFSGSSVCVMLDLADTPTPTTTSDEGAQIIAIDSCREIFRDALAAGCSTVILACSDVVKAAIGDIQVLAMLEGVVLMEHSLSSFLSSRMLNKSLVSTQVVAKQVLACAEKATVHGKILALYPGHSESDFFYPMILQKHACFLHAGACWNLAAFKDILGPSKELDDQSLLRPTLSLLLFSSGLTSFRPSDSNTSSTAAADRFKNAVMELLVGPRNVPPPTPKRRTKGETTELVSATAMSKVEGLLWTLLSGSGYSLEMTLPISKAEAVECLRQVKAILNDVDWGRQEESFRHGPGKRNRHCDSSTGTNLHHSSSKYQTDQLHNHQECESDLADIDEFMTTLQLFSTCCKIIIHAYNAAEKKHSTNIEFQSLGDLVDCLSPGTASDLANALLEAISHGSYRWRRRFENSFELHAPLVTLGNTWGKADRKHDRISSVRAIKYLKGLEKFRYFHTSCAEIPGMSLFTTLCKHIPAYSADVLLKVVEPPDQPIPPTITTTSSSWSLWGSR